MNVTHLKRPQVGRLVVVGVPNNGRLRTEVARLIGPSVGMSEHGRGLWYEGDGLAVACARSSDLPYLLAEGVVDLAITGYDYVVEAGVDLVELYDTGFQRCSIGILGLPGAKDWRERDHVVVATQYPGIATAYFSALSAPSSTIVAVSGAAELYARTGMADLIVDAHMTGETARANGLEYIETVFPTSGRIFTRPDLGASKSRIEAVLARLIP
jgi:ATP phosphoribosyltransferase